MGRRADDTRTEFLCAGMELLDEADAVGFLIGAVSVAGVCQRAGRSPGGFYHHWPSLEAFVDDLVVHTITEGTGPVFDSVVTGLSSLLGTATPARMYAQLERFFGAHFDTAVESITGTRGELIVWMSRDPDLLPWLRERQREFDAGTAQYLPAILQRWGRELRPPWTVDTMLRTLSALLFGFEVDQGIDPERSSRSTFVDAAMTIFATATRPIGVDLDFDDHLRLALSAGRGEIDSEWGASLRERTTPIIAEAYRRGGWPAVTVAAVADVADEYVEDVSTAWGGRPGMSVAVWRTLLVPGLRESMQRDLADGPVLVAVERHLQRVASLVDRHRDATRELMRISGAERDDDPPSGDVLARSTGLASMLASALLAAARQGELEGPLDTAAAADQASTVTALILFRVLMRADADPSELARQVFKLIAAGLVDDPAAASEHR